MDDRRRLSQKHATTIHAMGRQPGVLNRAANVIPHGRRPFAGQNLVRNFEQRLASPGDRDTNLGRLQKLKVILRVSDGDAVVQRQSQRVECLAQARGFADALRQQHHPAAIERQHQRKFQLLNGIKNPGRGGCIGFEHAITD